MKRKLLSQMRLEWRGNIWMILEFLLMTLVCWFSASMLISYLFLYHPSDGYDFDDVYVGRIGEISALSPNFVDYGSNEEYGRQAKDAVEVLTKTLANSPHVEIVGTGSNAIPFNYNYSGCPLSHITENGDTLNLMCHIRGYDGNAIKALRITGSRGEPSGILASYIDNGQVILSDFDRYSDVPEELDRPDGFRGKLVVSDGMTMQIAPVGVNYLRRTDYEPNDWSIVMMYPVALIGLPQQIIVRIKHGHDLAFLEELSEMNLCRGNVFFFNFQSVASIRKNVQKPQEISILTYISAIVFVLSLVFLGFLGTYWFRIQERVSEIAIRKAAGATRTDILRRLYAEGFVLMGIAVIVAFMLIFTVIHKNLLAAITGISLSDKLCYYGMGVTVVVMLLMVLTGIYFPARRAMKINPAIALKDQ